MQSIITYVIAHRAELATGAGALYTLLSVINGLIHSPKANTFLGDVLDVISYISRKGAAGSVKAPFTRSSAPSEPVVDGASARALLPLLLVGVVMLGACGHLPPLPTPDPAQYRAAFVACLEHEGVTDATNAGAQILNILDTGTGSAQQIEAEVERIAVTIGGDAAILVAQCAVDAWVATNPVPASTKPTPSQVAARLFRAKHLRRPTVAR